MITDAFSGDHFQRFAAFIDRNQFSPEYKEQQIELRRGLEDYVTDFDSVVIKALNSWGDFEIAPEWIVFHYSTGDVKVHEDHAVYIHGSREYKLSAAEFYCWRARFLDW